MSVLNRSEMISIYVDGSCLENQNVDQNTPAAWGLVVVSGDNGLGKGNGEIVEELFGNVVTSPSDKKYLGAAVGSNNTAELSRFAEALRWLLIEGSDIPAVIRTDSLYAGNLATGKWNPKANKKLVESLQKLWIEVSSIRDVEWEHVKAHRGHRWNESADHLALRCAQMTSPIPLSFWKPGQR